MYVEDVTEASKRKSLTVLVGSVRGEDGDESLKKKVGTFVLRFEG